MSIFVLKSSLYTVPSQPTAFCPWPSNAHVYLTIQNFIYSIPSVSCFRGQLWCFNSEVQLWFSRVLYSGGMTLHSRIMCLFQSLQLSVFVPSFLKLWAGFLSCSLTCGHFLYFNSRWWPNPSFATCLRLIIVTVSALESISGPSHHTWYDRWGWACGVPRDVCLFLCDGKPVLGQHGSKCLNHSNWPVVHTCVILPSAGLFYGGLTVGPSQYLVLLFSKDNASSSNRYWAEDKVVIIKQAC
jgi:hypothetical protein